MTDSSRLPGARLWTGPVQFYQWFRQVDAAITSGTNTSVDLAAITARVTALENGSAGGVTSFRGRSGAVVPQSGDYSQWFQPVDAVLTALSDPDTSSFADGDVLAWDASGGVFAATAPSVPYFIASGATYRVPQYAQALFSMPIDCEGFLAVDGYLVGVD